MTLEVDTSVSSLADVRSEIATLLLAKSWTNPSTNIFVSPSSFAKKMHLRMATPVTTTTALWVGSEALLFRFGTGNSGDTVTESIAFGQAIGGDSNTYGAGLVSKHIGQEMFPATLKLYYFPSEYMLVGMIVSGDLVQHFMFGECDSTIDQVSRIPFYCMPYGSYNQGTTHHGFPSTSFAYTTSARGVDVGCYGHQSNNSALCGFSSDARGNTSGYDYRPAAMYVGSTVNGDLGDASRNDDTDGWLSVGQANDGTLGSNYYLVKYGDNARRIQERFGSPYLMPHVVLNKSPTGNAYAGTYCQLAIIPNIRYMHVPNFDMAEEFRLGPDLWDSYPCFKKAQSSLAGTSWDIGMAVHKGTA